MLSTLSATLEEELRIVQKLDLKKELKRCYRASPAKVVDVNVPENWKTIIRQPMT
jgi:hypothetical protein